MATYTPKKGVQLYRWDTRLRRVEVISEHGPGRPARVRTFDDEGNVWEGDVVTHYPSIPTGRGGMSGEGYDVQNVIQWTVI